MHMTALVAVEFVPDANTQLALHSLRRPGLTVTSLDVSVKDAVASVEVANQEMLNDVLNAVCSCSCVRAGAAFPSDA